MTVTLRELPGCFEGMIPAVVATCSLAGVPNVVQLSQIHLVDDEHVALSNQFFTKTIANLAENPLASAVVIDPDTFDSYTLLLRHVRSETQGRTFDRMHADIEAIAALTGMAGVFGLRAVEVFRVLQIAPVSAAPAEEGHG